MDIKFKKKINITGRTLCLVCGMVCLASGVYWLVQSMFYDKTDFPVMLSSIFLGQFLVLSGRKR